MGLFKRTKNTNKPLLGQIIDLVPRWMLTRCAKSYDGDKGCSRYKTYDQFVALTFGQLNKCFTLNNGILPFSSQNTHTYLGYRN